MNEVSAHNGTQKEAGRSLSLRGLLVTLVLVCVLPAVIVSVWLTSTVYRLKQTQVEQQAAVLASTIMGEVERDMSAIESALKVLATAPELQAGDFAAFHRRASDALSQGIVINYILTDREGRQKLNTLVPWGTALPTTGTPGQLAAVFTQQRPVLTDLFMGPVSGKPVIAMGVPVVVSGEVVYSLNVGLSPDRLSHIASRQPLREGWLVAVLDQDGTIVGRSRDSQRFVGQQAVPPLARAVVEHGRGFLQTLTKEGAPVFSAYTTSDIWRWHVVVGAPTEQVQRDWVPYLWWLGGGVATALLAGVLVARVLALRVLASVRDLNTAAQALARGQPVVLPRVQLREAEAVGQAMLKASDAVQRIHFLAQHDTLTGLPNRLMFADIANRHLALAARRQGRLALLVLDLDGFKAVNDTLGHGAGDSVLQHAARRMLQTVRASDLVARVGGDEFLVLLTDVTPETAMDTAQRLVAALSAPFEGVSVPLSASVGLAQYPDHGTELHSLISRADHALYRAKGLGKARAVAATG